MAKTTTKVTIVDVADVDELARTLTVDERLELIAKAWDSIVADVGDALPITGAEREELDQRLAAHDAEPSRLRPSVPPKK